MTINFTDRFLVYDVNLQCGKHDLRINKDAHGSWSRRWS